MLFSFLFHFLIKALLIRRLIIPGHFAFNSRFSFELSQVRFQSSDNNRWTWFSILLLYRIVDTGCAFFLFLSFFYFSFSFFFIRQYPSLKRTVYTCISSSFLFFPLRFFSFSFFFKGSSKYSVMIESLDVAKKYFLSV